MSGRDVFGSPSRRGLLGALSVSMVGSVAGCTEETLSVAPESDRDGSADDRATPSASADAPPDEQVEWASMGLQHVAFESLTEENVRATATVEIRNPTDYRVPVNSVTCRLLADRDGSFAQFARGDVSGCGVVDFAGEGRSYYEYQQEAGPPCPPEKTDTFVVEPHEVTAITTVAEPRTSDDLTTAAQLVESNDEVFVRVDGAAVLWNTNVEIHFEKERVLRRPA